MVGDAGGSHRDVRDGDIRLAPSRQKTLFDKIWNGHVIREMPDGKTLLHIDRHILHDITAPQAFDTLRKEGYAVRNPELTAGTVDHIAATTPGRDKPTQAPG